MIAASLSFFACLQGLQRFGSFFSPLSWKKACSPEVQIKGSLQSTHLMLRSWYSESGLAPSSCTSSRSCMTCSPRVGLRHDPSLGRGSLRSCSAFVQRGTALFLASIGVSVGCPRSGGADTAKYNYGETVSRSKAAKNMTNTTICGRMSAFKTQHSRKRPIRAIKFQDSTQI